MFQCPQCSSPNSLAITYSIHLPADSRSDEIVLQVVECSHCGFRGAAVYEESRRGALEAESWDHTGYRVAPAQNEVLQALIQSCPQPEDPACQCQVHLELGRRDNQGRWRGWPVDKKLESFLMIIVDHSRSEKKDERV